MAELLAELEERYSALETQHELPSLDQMAFAFELRDAILHEGFIPEQLLRFVRRRIIQVLDSWAGYLHSLILPGEQSLVLYEESSHFSDEEKDYAMRLLRRIMRLNRMSVILEVEQSEERDAEFIREAHAEWGAMHEKLRPLLQKSFSVWDDKE